MSNSQKVVRVKLIVSNDVTVKNSIVTSLFTINFTLATFCEINARLEIMDLKLGIKNYALQIRTRGFHEPEWLTWLNFCLPFKGNNSNKELSGNFDSSLKTLVGLLA